MIDGYFSAEQMDKVQASVDSLCADVRKYAGVSLQLYDARAQLTSSTSRRLFRPFRPHHQLPTR
jgi:hypothetical protein